MITAMPRIAIAAPDFSGLVGACRHGLGLPVNDLSDEVLPTLGARLAMCVPAGGSHIELMSPAVAAAPLSQSLQRFLDRRGAGLFALMLESPDPDAEAERLAAAGLNVLPLMAGAGGRDVHPGSTHGVLIRIYPVDSYTGVPADDAPPCPLSGVQRVQIAVHDLDGAMRAYGQQIGLAMDPVRLDAGRGVASVRLRPPQGGQIELLAVRDPARPFAAALAAYLSGNPQGLYALVLHAADPAALLGELQSRGLPARRADDSADAIEISRQAMFGALIRIERAAA